MVMFPKPDRPPTNPQNARYLLMGAASQSGVYRTREELPTIPQGPNCPFIPLFIMCTSSAQADEYSKLIPLFEVFVGRQRNQLRKLFDVMEEESETFKVLMNRRHNAVYALLFGVDDHQGYYMYWPDLWPWTAHEQYQRSVCKRLSTFRAAMLFTIKEGATATPYGIPRNNLGNVAEEAQNIQATIHALNLDSDSDEDDNLDEGDHAVGL
ncbi:hypothetical protein NM688_g9317 [Phlebia brevispora]|uniref:Uncharacterized protein n=1 Tax=Phlebia brevispora TaxID=194682 RepID=A0ACC1RH01_9APHY|nr:hypothetical protein NM688_g9317 [Phlebia brevispora]